MTACISCNFVILFRSSRFHPHFIYLFIFMLVNISIFITFMQNFSLLILLYLYSHTNTIFACTSKFVPQLTRDIFCSVLFFYQTTGIYHFIWFLIIAPEVLARCYDLDLWSQFLYRKGHLHSSRSGRVLPLQLYSSWVHTSHWRQCWWLCLLPSASHMLDSCF